MYTLTLLHTFPDDITLTTEHLLLLLLSLFLLLPSLQSLIRLISNKIQSFHVAQSKQQALL